jgi:HK97 gp10 family phage protein
MLTLKITGIEDTFKALNQFGKGVKSRQLIKASSKAAAVIKPDVIARAPRETGTLAKAFVIKAKRTKDGEGAYAAIGANKAISVAVARNDKGTRKVIATFRTKKDGTIKVTGGKRLEKAFAEGKSGIEYRKPSRYLHLVEGGTKRGTRARRFMAGALAAKGPQAVKVFAEKLAKGVEEEAAKARTR